LATKANALFLPIILAPWLIYILFLRHRSEEKIVSKIEIIALVASPIVGLVFMFLAFPLLMINFPENFNLYISSLTERGYSGDAGINFMPVINAVVTMPLTILIAFAAGLVNIIYQSIKNKKLDDLHLLLLLWVGITLGRVSMPGANDFDGIRHWLEIVPAFAMIAAIGISPLFRLIIEKLKKKLKEREDNYQLKVGRAVLVVLIVIFFLPVTAWNIQNHPNQIVFFNSIVGGLKGAREHKLPDTTDYWGNSYRQGFEWLWDNADQDSMVYCGVAEQIFWYCREQWLRPDLVPTSCVGVRFDKILPACR